MILIIWLLAGFIGSGFLFASLQRELPGRGVSGLRKDQVFVSGFILYGFGCLIVGIMAACMYRHGWLNPFGKRAKQEAGII